MEHNNLDKLKIDYQHTIDQFKMLADIRFKLLAFVPTLAGAAIAFLSENSKAETAIAIGILGFFMTIGIIFYDVRNTQFYDAAAHRAKWLEALLDLPICTQDKPIGGLFNERPRHKLRFFGLFKVWHDRGLSLAYGAALGGWSYIIANSSLKLAKVSNRYIPLVIAVIMGSLCTWQYQLLSGLKKPQPNEDLKKEIEQRKTKKNHEKRIR